MERLRAMFPDREFFMRSQGKVRFVKVSSRVQMTAAAAIAALLLVWGATMTAAFLGQFMSTRDRLDLLNREAKVATAESRVAAYRKNLKDVAADLSKRQDFIDSVVNAQLGDLPADAAKGETVSDSSGEARKTVDKVSASLPEAGGLARMEARQLAFVERLTRFADRRSAAVANSIRAVGLDPASMMESMDDKSAQGGPLLRLSTSRDGSLDPRFQRLGVSLERMSTLVRGFAGIPQTLPATGDMVSSSYGYRTDPFTGAGAFHAGLDFRGPIGAPIYAAAAGRVSFVGQRQGYGNCVEIDHGNGLMTRYAHMSAFHTNIGQEVHSGDVIGAIGSTGRSTGPHLHFEVRIHDRPVNPRPFLEASSHVRQEQRQQQ